MNYSIQQKNMMVERYREAPTRKTVEELSEELGKSLKSIIGKLSREGVYRREVYKTKGGENPMTKLELVLLIAEELGLEEEELLGLDKAPKAVLKAMEVALSRKASQSL